MPASAGSATASTSTAAGLGIARTPTKIRRLIKGRQQPAVPRLGCIQAYKGYPPPQPPLEAEYRWDYSRAAMGAWLISISADVVAKDGDVTVTLESSIDPVTTQDANAHLQSDMTYRVAARPTSRNVLHGRIARTA